MKRGQNSYLKSNRDILCIQEKLRKSQVDDKVKSRTEKESGSVIFAPRYPHAPAAHGNMDKAPQNTQTASKTSNSVPNFV